MLLYFDAVIYKSIAKCLIKSVALLYGFILFICFVNFDFHFSKPLSHLQRRHASSEMVMLYRMFVQEEKINIERDKTDVQNGKS